MAAAAYRRRLLLGSSTVDSLDFFFDELLRAGEQSKYLYCLHVLRSQPADKLVFVDGRKHTPPVSRKMAVHKMDVHKMLTYAYKSSGHTVGTLVDSDILS